MERFRPFSGTWRRAARAAGGLALLALLALVAVLATVAWLLRDPEPYFLERHGRLASIEELAPSADGAFVEQEVRLRSSSGLRVAIAVRRPASADSARRPLFLLLGGHRRGMEAGRIVGDTRGNLIASLEYPYDGDPDAKGVAVLAQVPAIRRAIFDTPPAVMLALDYLLTRPDVDPARIELVGASFGAPFGAIAAALDTRVSRLWLLHGGGRPYRLLNAGLRAEIPFAPARAVVAGLANLLASGPRVAPERWVPRVAPRPIVMINARDDERSPPASVEALFRAAREPREQIWLPGRHMQPNRPDVMKALVDAVLERAARSVR